ncbi:MAG: hypothetical protein AAF351_03480 [Pseudomonadota bacterium]
MNKLTHWIAGVVLFAVLALSTSVAAQESAEELEETRKETFVMGMTGIVASLNSGSLDLFMRAIDQDDFQDRIYALRLIDPKLKNAFAENFEFTFEQLIKTSFPGYDKNGVSATLIGVDSRGTRGRAVVRYNLPDMQFSYHDYQLRLDDDERLVIVDWHDYVLGEEFTEHVGIALVSALPSNQAAIKLIDYKNVKSPDLFQFREALKAARDGNLKRYADIFNNMNPELKRQRVLVLKNVQFAKAINNRRMLREALTLMNGFYPEEPLFTLMLLDYWFPTRQYQAAYDGLWRTYRQLGFGDAAMEARLSAAALVLERVDDANRHAEQALEMDSEMELAWWSALRARNTKADFAGAVEALAKLEGGFGHELGPDAFAKDKSFAPLLDSAEYKAWLETR